MESKEIHKFIVLGIGIIAIFASYMTINGISETYHTSVSFFQGENSYYPYIITAVVASVPFVLFLILYFVQINKRPIIVSILSIYCLLVYLSIATILLVLLVAVWWFLLYKTSSSPNNSLKRDRRPEGPPAT